MQGQAMSASQALGELPDAIQERLKDPGKALESQDLGVLRSRVMKENRELLETLMRIPPRYRGKDLDSVSGYAPEKEQARIALSFDGSVFLSGSPGVGKTHMAIGLMWEWIRIRLRIEQRLDGGLIIWGMNYKQGDPEYLPLFLPAAEMYAEIKATFDGAGPDSERVLTHRYATAAFLVLDDVGAEQVTDWKRAVLYSLIDRRYRDMRQTIITSNLSMEGIASAIDERITSRIGEMGAVISLVGPDHRLRRAE